MAETNLDKTFKVKVPYLLNKMGKSATVKVPGSVVYNPATRVSTASSVVDHSVKITPPRGYKANMIDGEVIQKGDRQCLMEAQDIGFTPTPALQIVYDSETWEIKGVEEIYSGELIAAYRLQLRRN